MIAALVRNGLPGAWAGRAKSAGRRLLDRRLVIFGALAIRCEADPMGSGHRDAAYCGDMVMSEAGVADEFTITGTSRSTADVNDVAIGQKELTRIILRSELIVNQQDPDASVKACLMHQKRHSSKASWQDADSFSRASLKAGQEVRFSLNASETRNLYDALGRQYRLPVGGWVKAGEERLAVVDRDRFGVVPSRTKQQIDDLLAQEGEQVLDVIEELRPGLVALTALKRQQASRLTAVDRFRAAMKEEEWKEADWQRFFDQNTWIFGHNLAYQFLHKVASQPHYGGTRVSGRGRQRGDFLMATQAAARFTVLVDIKKPNADLVTGRSYRNQAHQLGPELVGGVTQLQANCQTWYTEGAVNNAAEMDGANTFTYQPKGILVIGNTAQLENGQEQSIFELFRRNLYNPEIVTFDELLARASYMVSVNDDTQEDGVLE